MVVVVLVLDAPGNSEDEKAAAALVRPRAGSFPDVKGGGKRQVWCDDDDLDEALTRAREEKSGCGG